MTHKTEILLSAQKIYGNSENAMLVRDGIIAAIGDYKELKKNAQAEVSERAYPGCWIYPGMVESHGHLEEMGRVQNMLNFTSCTGPEQVYFLAQRRAKHTESEKWILGRGWDQNLWENPVFPDGKALSEQVPQNPVYFIRRDGHAAWVNEKALQLAGITAQTSNPIGGEIIRDIKGNPTGVLIDRAMELVLEKIPPATSQDLAGWMELGMTEALSRGVTSFHDAYMKGENLAILQQQKLNSELKLRVYCLLAGDRSELVKEWYQRGPQIDPWLTVRGIKLFADGALGSCGAHMFEPFSNDDSNMGLELCSEQEIYEQTLAALKAGFQVGTHAIGDKANHLTLNGYERALKEVPKGDYRLRVEHAQFLAQKDVQRFNELNVIASMQATHCTSDMFVADKLLGVERAKEIGYLWKSLLLSGAEIAGGSDAPIESVNPFWGSYAALTRQDHKGHPEGGWNAHQCLSFDEVISTYTWGGAFASFEENHKGALRPNMYADFIVLDRDPAECSPQELLQLKVLATYVGGKRIFEN